MTRLLPPDAAGLAEAARLLRAGRLVAFPTETVYGLGADATDARAVSAIYRAKGRPAANPLILHVEDEGAAARLAHLSEDARALMAAFWPGPLTLVLAARDGAAPAARAGLPTLALRSPAHPLARALLLATGRPIAAPSANPSGRVSPTTAAHVLAGLSGRPGNLLDAVLDGGPCPVGVESTILALDPAPRLLREGGLPREALEALLGPLAAPAPHGPLLAPGMLPSHYAPRAALRLDAPEARPGEAHLGFGPVRGDLSLSPGGDLAEAAANLFAALHALDATATAIAVAPIPEEGLGRAINDRLRRAAAPRP